MRQAKTSFHEKLSHLLWSPRVRPNDNSSCESVDGGVQGQNSGQLARKRCELDYRYMDRGLKNFCACNLDLESGLEYVLGERTCLVLTKARKADRRVDAIFWFNHMHICQNAAHSIRNANWRERSNTSSKPHDGLKLSRKELPSCVSR
jgi:hypothetical protein